MGVCQILLELGDAGVGVRELLLDGERLAVGRQRPLGSPVCDSTMPML